LFLSADGVMSAGAVSLPGTGRTLLDGFVMITVTVAGGRLI
jgi:hypothetical protein